MSAPRLARGAALAMVLAAIGGTGLAKDKKDDSPAVVAARDFDKNPYPSTYRVYPGVPTALVAEISSPVTIDGPPGMPALRAPIF